MYGSAFSPITRSVSPSWSERAYRSYVRDELDDLHSRIRRVDEEYPFVRHGRCRSAWFDCPHREEQISRTPSRSRVGGSRGRSASRSSAPSALMRKTMYTFHGAIQTEETVKSSPFYTLINIPFDALDRLTFSNPGSNHDEIAVVFHAVHPVPRGYLRKLIQFDYDTAYLRFVGEHLDELLYPMTEWNELANCIQETVHRVNELLAQKGENSIGCPCGHREKVALRRGGRGGCRGR
jgi:hypothetical protein